MSAKWITTEKMAKLSPISVFHKAADGYVPPTSEVQAAHILFRRRFSLTDAANATVKISADDYYKLYINGAFVACGPAPSYPAYYAYNQIDVFPYLHAGENVIAVHTYYNGQINRVWVSGDNLHGLYLSLCQNGKEILASDESFLVSEHTAFSVEGTYGYKTGYLERYDSNAKECGFENIDFDDKSWQNAVVNPNIAHNLSVSAPMLVFEKIEPTKVEADGRSVKIDLGREICGYVKISAMGQKDSVVLFRQAEELNDDGTLRYHLRCNCDYEESWVLSGGFDTYQPFDYRGFRYLEFLLPEGCELFLDTLEVTARHNGYRELPFVSELEKREPKLGAIVRLCADTVKYGIQEVAVDCPTREKGQYLGDAGFIGMTYAALTGSAEPLKRSLCDFARSSFICPGLMAVSTSSFMQEIADYSMNFPAFVWAAYQTDKDIAFLREMYPTVLGVYRYFKCFENADGVLSDVTEKWNLVDWPANLRDNYDFPLTDPVTPGTHNVPTAYFIGMGKCINEIAKELGEVPPCDVAHNIDGFLSYFFDAEANLFKDRRESKHHSLHANVLPLLFDIGITPAVKENVLSMIREKKLVSVNYFAYYILLALERIGEYDLAHELLLSPDAWSNMLKEGATTCFEAWGKEKKKNCSLFHPWMSYAAIFAKSYFERKYRP